MIKKLIILGFVIFTNQGICGVSVLGTRFEIKDNGKPLNIKIYNDNESDYLIKSTFDDDDFIIVPPLMFLKKNSSNLITIISKKKKKNSEDKISNLTISAIPKSSGTDGSNSVSMAIRSHFKVIHRHKEMDESIFSQVMLIKENNHCTLVNNSDFVLILSSSGKKNENVGKLFTIKPHNNVTLVNKKGPWCNSWVHFHNEYNDVIKSIFL